MNVQVKTLLTGAKNGVSTTTVKPLTSITLVLRLSTPDVHVTMLLSSSVSATTCEVSVAVVVVTTVNLSNNLCAIMYVGDSVGDAVGASVGEADGSGVGLLGK